MHKFMLKTSALSLVTAIMLSTTGCSTNPIDEETSINEVSTISGKAVDGYLRYSTVCLDLNDDGFCQPTEPFSITDVDGAFTLQLSDAHKADANYKKAQLVVFGGQDSDRPGEDFIGKLKAPNDGTGQVNVTPITTLVSAYIKQSNGSEVSVEDIQKAKTKVAAILGIDADKVDDDPRADGDAELMNATLQLQYAVNTMVKATKKDTSVTDTEKDIAEDIFTAFAAGLNSVNEGQTLEAAVSDIIDKAPAAQLNQNAVQAKVAAQIAAQNVNTVMTATDLDVSNAVSLQQSLTEVVILQEKVIQDVETKDFTTTVTFDTAALTFDETEIDSLDLDLEAAKIYLEDMGLADANASLYAGTITLDKSLEELQAELSNDTTIATALETKLSEIDAVKDEQAAAVAEQEAAAKIAVVSEKVNALLATDKNATVADAKNMVAQLRETVVTFIDIDAQSPDANTSTIVGAQADLVMNKIKPAVDTIASDFNVSANALQQSGEAFVQSIETNFGAVIGSTDQTTGTYTPGAIETRIKALVDQIPQDANGTFSVTALTAAGTTDTLSATRTMNTTTYIVTETITFNGVTVTVTFREYNDVTGEEGSNGPLSIAMTNGPLVLSGTGYNLNVSSFSFANTGASIKATGSITGLDSSSMTLTDLTLKFNFDTVIDNPTALSNIEASFDGTIVSSGRTLHGDLTVSEAANTATINGSYAGITGEPTLSGKAVIKVPFGDVKNFANDQENRPWHIDPNALLMVTFTDGSKSFVSSSTTTDGTNYTLNTQSGTSITCSVTNVNTMTSYSHNVACTGGSVKAYYGDDKIMTMTVNGVDMIVSEAWTEYYQDPVTNASGQQPFIALDKWDHEIYTVGNEGVLYMNGTEAVISNITLTAPKDMSTVAFDAEITGTILHNDINISATAGIKNGVNPYIYAKNLKIADGASYASVTELSATFAQGTALFADSGDSMGGQMSTFENYSYDYYNYSSNNDNGPMPLALNATDVTLSIDDNNGSVLVVSANLSYAKSSLDEHVTFNGSYTYADTSFTGVADVKGNLDSMIASIGVSGRIEANGFAPFSLTAAAAMTGNNEFDAYGLFTRENADGNYSIGLHVSNESNATAEVHTLKLADSKGVMIDFLDTVLVDSNTSATISIPVTNVAGDSLADFGPDATNNSWEIIYNEEDGSTSSETLF